MSQQVFRFTPKEAAQALYNMLVQQGKVNDERKWSADIVVKSPPFTRSFSIELALDDKGTK